MNHNFDNFNDDGKKNANPKKSNKTSIVSKKRKKNHKMIYILSCAIAAVVFALVAFFVFFDSTQSSLEYTWLHKSQDGNDYYYTFTETSDGGKLEISIGTDYFKCTYDIGDNDTITTSYANSEVYSDNLIGEYEYSISEENGEDVLTLKSLDGSSQKLTKVDRPEDTDYLKPYENFKVDKDIVGKWEIKYSMGSLKLDINDDGTMVLNLLDTEYQHYVYTVTNQTLKMSLFKDQLIEFEEPYQLTDGKLTFLGIPWDKVQ